MINNEKYRTFLNKLITLFQWLTGAMRIGTNDTRTQERHKNHKDLYVCVKIFHITCMSKNLKDKVSICKHWKSDYLSKRPVTYPTIKSQTIHVPSERVGGQRSKNNNSKRKFENWYLLTERWCDCISLLTTPFLCEGLDFGEPFLKWTSHVDPSLVNEIPTIKSYKNIP